MKRLATFLAGLLTYPLLIGNPAPVTKVLRVVSFAGSQGAGTASGAATGGGQRTLVRPRPRAACGRTTLHLRNTSSGAEARSGDAHTRNEFVIPAGTWQGQDEEIEIKQTAEAVSGDAVAGAQVVNVEACGDVALYAENHAEDPEARSGNATATNEIVFLCPAPCATPEVTPEEASEPTPAPDAPPMPSATLEPDEHHGGDR